MIMPPAEVIASWPAPNTLNPEGQAPRNAILICVFQTVVTFILVVRLYTRWKMSNGLRLDDGLIVAAFVPTTAFAILGIIHEQALHLDRHIWDLPLDEAPAALKLKLAASVVFGVATTLTKLSMLALIYRLVAAAGDVPMRRITLAVVAVVATGGATFVIVAMNSCRPLASYWTLSSRPQACINEPAALLVAGCINTVTDFLIVLLPIRTVMGLKLPRRQLFIIQGLLTGGIFATAAGAVRTYYTWDMLTAFDYDMPFRSHKAITLGAVELYIGIICGSLPATKPFFRQFIPRLLGTSAATTGHQSTKRTTTITLTSLKKHKRLSDNTDADSNTVLNSSASSRGTNRGSGAGGSGSGSGSPSPGNGSEIAQLQGPAAARTRDTTTTTTNGITIVAIPPLQWQRPAISSPISLPASPVTPTTAASKPAFSSPLAKSSPTTAATTTAEAWGPSPLPPTTGASSGFFPEHHDRAALLPPLASPTPTTPLPRPPSTPFFLPSPSSSPPHRTSQAASPKSPLSASPSASASASASIPSLSSPPPRRASQPMHFGVASLMTLTSLSLSALSFSSPSRRPPPTAAAAENEGGQLDDCKPPPPVPGNYGSADRPYNGRLGAGKSDMYKQDQQQKQQQQKQQQQKQQQQQQQQQQQLQPQPQRPAPPRSQLYPQNSGATLLPRSTIPIRPPSWASSSSLTALAPGHPGGGCYSHSGGHYYHQGDYYPSFSGPASFAESSPSLQADGSFYDFLAYEDGHLSVYKASPSPAREWGYGSAGDGGGGGGGGSSAVPLRQRL